MESLNQIKTIHGTNESLEGAAYEKKDFLKASIEDWQEILFNPLNKKFNNKVDIYEHVKSQTPFFCGSKIDLFLKFSQYSLNAFTFKLQRDFWKVYLSQRPSISIQAMFMKLEQHETPLIVLENFISYKRCMNPADWAISDIRNSFVNHLATIVAQNPTWKNDFALILKDNIDHKDWQFLIKTIIKWKAPAYVINSFSQEIVPQLLANMDKKDLIKEVANLNVEKCKNKML